jgi:hypothetical protein
MSAGGVSRPNSTRPDPKMNLTLHSELNCA